MNNDELRNILNKIALTYSTFTKDKDIEELRNVWKDAIGEQDYEATMKKLNEHIADKPFPPKPSELRTATRQEHTFYDSHTFRKIALAYADSVHVSAPHFNSEQEALDWMDEQEKMR